MVISTGLLRGDDRGLTDEDAERRLERRRLPTKRRVLTHYDHVCKCVRYTCDRMWMHLDIVCATGTRYPHYLISKRNVALLFNR